MAHTAGNSPNGGLILRGDDRVWGTAAQGGTAGGGVVFVLTPPATAGGAWNYDVKYNFAAGAGGPEFGLTFGLGGALYGTLPAGGSAACGESGGYGNGCGVIYQVGP